MAIADDDIERLRSTVSIVDVVGQFVAAAQGRAQLGRAVPVPRREDARRSTSARRPGRYKCFGCDKSGDVFTFVQEHEHVDFVGAVEYLAAKAGMQLTYTSTGQSRERARRKQLVEAMATAVEWYHQRLLEDPAARAARDYLRVAGPERRRRPDVQARLGARRLGRPGARSPASTASCCGPPAWRSPTAATGMQDALPGRACCSRSSPTPARRWRSAGGSCPARTTRRSTRTRRRRRSTPSRRRCTGSTGRRPTSPPPTRSVVCEGYTDVIGFHQAGVRAGRGHVRHGVHRGPRAAAQALRQPGRAGLRRRRRRPGRRRAVLRVGAEVPGAGRRWPGCPAGRIPATWPSATPTALAAAVADAAPFLGVPPASG